MKQNWMREKEQSWSSQTLKSIELIIVAPTRIGWIGMQKKRTPIFMLPLSRH